MSTTPPPVNAKATSENFGFDALGEAVNYRRVLAEEFRPYLRGAILEVGAGIGQFTEELKKLTAVTAIDALEPDPKFYTVLVQRLTGVRFHGGTVGELAPLPLYDGIVCVNVLEHIEDHLGGLREFKQRLRPGGTLCLFVPAGPSIYAPIDRAFGHYRRYTRLELRGLLVEAGFRVTRLDYYNSLGYLAWWFNFCLLRKTVFEVGKVRFYDRFIFLPVHALESRLMRPPFGQSLLAIAQA